MFTFTPLLGSQSGTRASQSILELDGGVKVLVDVGWDERFDPRQLAEIEKMSLLYLSSYLHMLPLPTLVLLLIAASTSHSLLRSLFTLPHLSSLLGALSYRISTRLHPQRPLSFPAPTTQALMINLAPTSSASPLPSKRSTNTFHSSIL
jgi:hypothetical protein